MISYAICLIVATAIFTLYNGIILFYYKIPSNISITRYWLELHDLKLGKWLSIMFITLCVITTPIWINISLNYSQTSKYFTFLIPLTILGILVVAITPHYYTKQRLKKIHYISASISATTAYLWLLIIGYNIFYISVIIFIFFLTIATLTNTTKKCILYWLELTSFYSVFVTLLVLNALQL